MEMMDHKGPAFSSLLEKSSRAERVYFRLKVAILDRKIAPGTQLIEKTISHKLQVSRTPIRKAMDWLEKEGLVKVISNRGTFVVQPSSQEIEQAFHMRARLEKMTLEIVTGQMKEDGFQQLRELVKWEKFAFETNDKKEYLDLVKQFHMLLAKKTDNPFLISFTEKILDQIYVYSMLYNVAFGGRLSLANRCKEHEFIIEALEGQDLGILNKHIDQQLEESIREISVEEEDSYSPLEEVL
ncbi:GntR family transcriptional regulator [Halobacillus rhizosphaerae]|uniref:GntR family transcriptional regulator n=1 Tax=Halobacillus rhizosphaerae TaxID=3064889 RepID=UPI00398B8926